MTLILKFWIDLLAILLLALGIKGLSKVRSAREANRLAAIAMAIAVLGVLIGSFGSLIESPEAWVWIILGSSLGGLFGAFTAQRLSLIHI